MNKKNEPFFRLDPDLGYFRCGGAEIMAFDDIYPEGHQSGVSLILCGKRVAANGDIRFEPTPGQWQPVPKQTERIADPAANSIRTRLSYPDRSRPDPFGFSGASGISLSLAADGVRHGRRIVPLYVPRARRPAARGKHMTGFRSVIRGE